jgi:hypothetical protein
MLEAMLLKKKVSSSGPFRFIRLNNMMPVGGGYTSITELQIVDTGSGTNWCVQPGAVASARGSYTGQTPNQAIDGYNDSNPSHRWSSDGVTPTWFMVDMGQPRVFDSILMSTHLASSQQAKSFVIQGSVDGTNFTDLKTVTNQTYTAEYVFTEIYK